MAWDEQRDTAAGRRRTAPSGGDARRQNAARTGDRRRQDRPLSEEEAVQRRREADRRRRQSSQRARQRESERRSREQPVNWTQPKPYDKRKLLLRLLTGVAVALALLLSMTIFFKVDKVTVSGCEKYTQEAVLKASGIKQGDNLLTFGRTRAEGRIHAALPYVNEVRIGIKLPDTVNIEIVETTVSYAIQADTGAWWLMDAGGKLLEQLPGEPTSYTKVVGVLAEAPAAGQTVTPTDSKDAAASGENGVQASTPKERFDTAVTILGELEKNGLMSTVTQVNVSGLYDLQLLCGEKYLVRLGGPTELSYKTAYLAKVLEQLEDYQAGTIDLTLDESRQARFISN